MRSISSSVILSAVRSYSFVVFGDAWPAIRFIAVNVRPLSDSRAGRAEPFLGEASFGYWLVLLSGLVARRREQLPGSVAPAGKRGDAVTEGAERDSEGHERFQER